MDAERILMAALAVTQLVAPNWYQRRKKASSVRRIRRIIRARLAREQASREAHLARGGNDA